MSTLQAYPFALNEFFNKTVEILVSKNATTDGVILSHLVARTVSNYKKLHTMTDSSLSNDYNMIVQLDATTSQFLLSNQQPNTSPHL